MQHPCHTAYSPWTSTNASSLTRRAMAKAGSRKKPAAAGASLRRRPTAAGVSVRRTPAAAGASQPRSLLRKRTTTAGVSVRRKPAAAGAPFVHTEGDWPCLSPLVGSCLRRDTPEAAAILGKSLSAIASTEELVLTASSVLLVLPASSGYRSPPDIFEQ